MCVGSGSGSRFLVERVRHGDVTEGNSVRNGHRQFSVSGYDLKISTGINVDIAKKLLTDFDELWQDGLVLAGLCVMKN